MSWPPILDELKADRGIESSDVRDDERLQMVLDAAVSFVERVRPDLKYDATDPNQLELPEPGGDVRLGTLRLAGRWHDRRRSPDGMVAMAELGVGRVSTFDGDIDRLLRIGRHQRMRVG